MSHVQHLTVIVTGWNKELLNQAKEKAIELFTENMVTNTAKSLINQYESFMVCSSGSKGGWEEDTEHKQKIQKYVKYLDSKAFSEKKHDNSLQYVVLSYGDSGSKVEKTNQIKKFN
ncbi:hypothetical protein N496_19625 (plasmid) [Clostridium botulinum A2B3 87]|uniref:hypothetical protein n=1 Tax=Clostridium botulinum TaxID=1491 RepID=UPI0004A582DF|nr:hypothetical protein [Clostridium botulinum]KEI95159.1 hypothetical protein N496_19625 [Clostridium botulinum A2B3 87]